MLFQSHHKGQRNALVTIEKLGGKAELAKSNADYAAALGAGGIKFQTDVLTLAARLAADVTMHWSLLANALGKPVPVTALSFGI